MRRLMVSDVMTSPVVAAREATPFRELARIMNERRVSALPVLDADDYLVGMVSEADLLPKEAHRDDPTGWRLPKFGRQHDSLVKAAGDTAGQVMTRSVATIHPDATVVEAAREMGRQQVKRLPVVNQENRLIGIVARADLLKTFLRTDEEIRNEVISEVFIRVLWADPERFDVSVQDGIVTLSGELAQSSHIATAVELCQRVDGVVDVVNHLTYAIEDSGHSTRPF